MNNMLNNIKSRFRRLISSSQQTDIISGLVEPLVRKVSFELILPEGHSATTASIQRLIMLNPYVIGHETPKINMDSSHKATIEVEMIGDHKEELIRFLERGIKRD